MNSFFQTALVAHIISGSAGLVSGAAIMALPKGSKLHRKLGIVFFWAMLGVFFTSIYMSLQTSNWFLLCIGFFSFFLTASGYRILKLKTVKKISRGPAFVDHIIGISGILAGAGMWILAYFLFDEQGSFGIVPAVFGTFSMALGIGSYQLFTNPHVQKTHWLTTHATRMGGAFTSTVTAFIVVNIQTNPTWLGWMLPTAIIIPLSIFQLKRFIAPKPGKQKFNSAV